MRMKNIFIATGLLLSILFTVMTLMHKNVAQRYLVDPNIPPYHTEFVDAWGWPLVFVIDNPRKSHMHEIGFEDKFIFSAFLIDWLFLTVVTFIVLSIFVVASRRYRKFC